MITDTAGSDKERHFSAPGVRLTTWLVNLVHDHDYGRLAELRRPDLRRNAHIQAGWFDHVHRDTFALVAFLFAIYHRGASRPDFGRGSLGAAACRIGTGVGRGPEDPGAQRLMDRIVASRRPPMRHLQHAITRLRSCEQRPPSWVHLAGDLCRWNDGVRDIPYDWAVDFNRPHWGKRR
jgi:CRISPR system Cascade subunit CasA